MNKLSTKALFLIMTGCAFVSVISFFQIDSYWADKHHFNGIFGWLGLGILFGAIAILTLIKILGRQGGSNIND